MTGDIFAEKIWFFLARYIVVRKWLDLLQMAFWQNLPGSEYVLVHYILILWYRPQFCKKVDTECYLPDKFDPVDRELGFQNALIV